MYIPQHTPALTRPALPLRCRAEARLTQSSTSRLMPRLGSCRRSCTTHSDQGSLCVVPPHCVPSSYHVMHSSMQICWFAYDPSYIHTDTTCCLHPGLSESSTTTPPQSPSCLIPILARKIIPDILTGTGTKPFQISTVFMLSSLITRRQSATCLTPATAEIQSNVPCPLRPLLLQAQTLLH